MTQAPLMTARVLTGPGFGAEVTGSADGGAVGISPDEMVKWSWIAEAQGKSRWARRSASTGLMIPTGFPSGSSTMAYRAPQKAS
jgi:RES domain-containing protein